MANSFMDIFLLMIVIYGTIIRYVTVLRFTRFRDFEVQDKPEYWPKIVAAIQYALTTFYKEKTQ